jgi:hypothetical protein
VVLTEDGITLFEQYIAGKAGTATVFTRSDGVLWGKSHQHRPLREACRRAGINPPASFHICATPTPPTCYGREHSYR